jgi:CDP-diacylglycerol--serine O-phosphatidyltransferase
MGAADRGRALMAGDGVPSSGRRLAGLPLRSVPANAITAAALCFGLTGVRFAISGKWEMAMACIIGAGVLDGLDGRVARMLKGESRFGAELDSLSDTIAFGVSPALIIYLWSLQEVPRIGWFFALGYAVSCALRLARFNAGIDIKDQPHKSAGFLTGVPAPAGAGLMFCPHYIWTVTGEPLARNPWLVAPWVLLVSLLMISNLATFSWSSLRLRRDFRLPAILLLGLVSGLLISEPWATLLAISVAYVLLIPFSVRAYARVRRRRAMPGGGLGDMPAA